MPACLVSLDGKGDIPLQGLLTIVGRHRGCEVRLDSSRVSRRHCCLAVDRDEVIVRDLGSTNGTWLNGERVDEGILRDGDELSIAHLRYRLVLRDDRRSRPAPGQAPRGPSAAAYPTWWDPDCGR